MRNSELCLCFIVISFFTTVKSNGQTELEIKTTGKFLYSWAIENDEASAKENAKLGLLDTIFISILRESAIDQTDTVFIKVIDYFVKQVGFKWQAIAFADKADIRIQLEQHKQLKVIPVVFGDLKGNFNSSAYAQVKVDNEPNNSAIDGNNHIETQSPFMQELILIRDGKTLIRRLSKLKGDLVLNFGSKSSYPEESGCYLFIVDNETNYVTAIYDKGSEVRRNILNNEYEKDYVAKYKGDQFIYVVFN
jgi:hypothetical protein